MAAQNTVVGNKMATMKLTIPFLYLRWFSISFIKNKVHTQQFLWGYSSPSTLSHQIIHLPIYSSTSHALARPTLLWSV